MHFIVDTALLQHSFSVDLKLLNCRQLDVDRSCDHSLANMQRAVAVKAGSRPQ